MNGTPQAPLRLVVIDHDTDVRERVCALLNASGHVAVGMTTLELEAELPSHGDSAPDVILLDPEIPGVDGWQVWADRLTTPAWAAIPVVLMTASRERRVLPADEVVFKPFKVYSLLEAISRSVCTSLVAEEEVTNIANVVGVAAILKLIRDSSGLRTAVVARVTPREWLCCAVSTDESFKVQPGEHLDVTATLSAEVRRSRSPLVVSYASTDADYANHPARRSHPFETYIAAPIILPSGAYFGDICAFDVQPKPVAAHTLTSLSLLADNIASQLEGQRDALRRDRFVAKFVHDLRTPLSSITTGADVLLQRNLADSEKRVVQRIERGAERITSLIDGLVDFTRGRIG